MFLQCTLLPFKASLLTEYIHLILRFILFLGLELLQQAIANAGYTGRVQIAMDVAASGRLALLMFYHQMIVLVTVCVPVFR